MTPELMATMPQTLPITVEQFRLLVEHDMFADRLGQVELIHGKVVEMNPQGPEHADPIDELQDWSHRYAGNQFRIRIEKPIEIPGLNSSPEPDIAWVANRRYADRHPLPEDVHLLIEVSGASKAFDGGEKAGLYAQAGIAEYWIVDIAEQTLQVMTRPDGLAYKKSTLYDGEAEVSPACLPSAVLSIAQIFSDSLQ